MDCKWFPTDSGWISGGISFTDPMTVPWFTTDDAHKASQNLHLSRFYHAMRKSVT